MTDSIRKSAVAPLPQPTACTETTTPRQRVQWFGHVIDDGAMQAVKVHEVSRHDAVLWCFGTVPTGDRLTLFVPEIGHVQANVARRDGQQIHIDFTEAPADAIGEAA